MVVDSRRRWWSLVVVGLVVGVGASSSTTTTSATPRRSGATASRWLGHDVRGGVVLAKKEEPRAFEKVSILPISMDSSVFLLHDCWYPDSFVHIPPPKATILADKHLGLTCWWCIFA